MLVEKNKLLEQVSTHKHVFNYTYIALGLVRCADHTVFLSEITLFLYANLYALIVVLMGSKFTV